MDCARAKRDVGEAYKGEKNLGAIRTNFNTLGGLRRKYGMWLPCVSVCLPMSHVQTILVPQPLPTPA